MTRSPFWKTWVALAVAAGLGAYIYFVESKRPAPSDEKPKEKVFTLDRAKVNALTLAPAGGEAVRLVKEKDGWRLKAAGDVAADPTQVEAMVSGLESAQAEEVVAESPASLAEYGLESPRHTVTVGLEGAKDPLVLMLGEKTPDGGALYARTPDKPRVFTVAAWLESTFDKKPFDLRDRDVLRVKRDAVRGLEVTGPQGSYTLARTEGGEWAFTQPLPTHAGRWSVDGLLGQLESLRMESVAAEEAGDPAPYGLDKPTRTVTLVLGDGTRKTLRLGSQTATGSWHAQVSDRPLVALIPGALVDDLAKGMGELRAKRLLEVSTYDVTGFEAEVGGAKRTYSRTTSKDKDGLEVNQWRRTAPEAKDLDTSKVQDALFAIAAVDVMDFVDRPGPPAGYGLDAPALKVSLQFQAGRPPVTFEVAEKDGEAWARRSGDEAVLKVDPKKAADLIKAFREL